MTTYSARTLAALEAALADAPMYPVQLAIRLHLTFPDAFQGLARLAATGRAEQINIGGLPAYRRPAC